MSTRQSPARPARPAHVYSWARQRGFHGRRDTRKDGAPSEVSHLLLDGGVLSVPPANTAEFTAAYAVGVVRGAAGGPRPCVVEVKTDVFRMFYDLDAVVTAEDSAALSAGVVPPAIEEALVTICRATLSCFPTADKTTVTVCASNSGKNDGKAGSDEAGHAKHGIHLTFSDVFVTSPTARAVRLHVLDALDHISNPFRNEWTKIVDEAVFKGSGMRLPWSAKRGDPDRVYVPIADILDPGVNPRVTPIDPAAVARSVTATRQLLAQVTLRSTALATPTASALEPASTSSSSSSPELAHASLREFEGSLPAIEAAIPPEYAGRVTAVMRGENAVLFRHSSRWCANVGREHHSSNCYFLLTRRGLQQCCYCRKDDEADRKWGSCADFRGEVVRVPKGLLEELFPPPTAPDAHAPPPLPSQCVLTFEELVDRSRARAFGHPKRKAPDAPDVNPFSLGPRMAGRPVE